MGPFFLKPSLGVEFVTKVSSTFYKLEKHEDGIKKLGK